MAKLLLEHPEPVTGVVELYRVGGEGIPEPVRAHSVHFACFRINQIW